MFTNLKILTEVNSGFMLKNYSRTVWSQAEFFCCLSQTLYLKKKKKIHKRTECTV